jgi:hypothetical protein
LVPRLVARGHRVTATTTSAAKFGPVERMGAQAVLMDGLDAMSVGEAVAAARPDVIVHQMTGISLAHAGKPDLKHFDRWSVPTIRLRTEGTDHLLAAAEAAGVPHFVAQGYANWNGIREGGWVKTEQDPLDLHEGTPAYTAMAALDAGRPRFEADRKERDELAARFLGAVREGDVEGLRKLLAADVALLGDAGGKAPQWARGFAGADTVIEVLAALLPPFVRIGGIVEPHPVNGQPGAVFRDRDGKILTTWTLDILDQRVQTIRAVSNPDKLAHLGPVADAWAVLRETQRLPADAD